MRKNYIAESLTLVCPTGPAGCVLSKNPSNFCKFLVLLHAPT